MGIEWKWIDNQQDWEKAFNDICNSLAIGIDTEYDSFRYFREKLCLIQISTSTKTYLIDPLQRLDISMLGKILADEKILKILHAGDNDIRLLNRDYGFVFNNIFDTYRAAAVLGCESLSLSFLLRHCLGVEVEKTKKMQRSQWEKRPLTDRQLEYAVRDTSHLLGLCHAMQLRIKEQNLEKRAYEMFQNIANVRWTEKILDLAGHKKIKGYEELTEEQKSRLQALFRWRFNKAKQINVARFMILSDTNLIEISKSAPDSIEALNIASKLSPKKVNRFGREIVSLLMTL